MIESLLLWVRSFALTSIFIGNPPGVHAATRATHSSQYITPDAAA
jgi:hypothetical protein